MHHPYHDHLDCVETYKKNSMDMSRENRHFNI